MAFRTQRDLDRLALPAGKTEVFHFDVRCPGLSVRIQRTGKPAFVAWFTAPGGKRKRITIGAVAGINLDQARRQATQIVNAARDGRDPGQERKLARIAAAGATRRKSMRLPASAASRAWSRNCPRVRGRTSRKSGHSCSGSVHQWSSRRLTAPAPQRQSSPVMAMIQGEHS